MILDMCMAPGGFLQTALSVNPTAHAVAFSLPMGMGGHKVLIPKDEKIVLKFLDITMLAVDMGVVDFPLDHEEYSRFLPCHFGAEDMFDLVLCDGQVLRTQSRAEYREKREARRLSVTQLALGLEHIRAGGTMIMLLHKVEAWHTVSLLYSFSKFSSVRLFKPTTGHTKRSSFYMVATKIQRQHPEAVRAIEKWKAIWKAGTFGNDEEYWKAVRDCDPDVKEVLKDFGLSLVELGRETWATQARALAKAPFIRARE